MESDMTMTEIVPNLWLGDLISALDVETLRARGVQSVLSVMRGKVTVHETFIRRQVSLDDSEDEDILTHMGPCIKFIEKELANDRGVLVHCQAGVSRSATIVAAYLMSTQHLSRIDALALIRSKRPFIDPNFGFVKQLDLFYEAGYIVTQDNQAVRRWYLKRQADHMRVHGHYPGNPEPYVSVFDELQARGPMRFGLGKGAPSYQNHVEPGPSSFTVAEPQGEETCIRPSESTLSPGSTPFSISMLPSSPPTAAAVPVPPASPTGPTRRFMTAHAAAVHADQLKAAEAARMTTSTKRRIVRCRMCRVELAGREHMLEHVATLASPLPNSNAFGEEGDESASSSIMANSKCSGYFVEPLKWMTLSEYKGSLSGKILCPNKRCKAKIGNYTWLGVQCGCGGWVIPSFCLGKGKVDEITVG